MKLLVKTILITASMMICVPGRAQVPYTGIASYESAAAPLRSAAARQYNFSKAVMGDVMRLMAEDAGIGFFGLPDGGDDRIVTFTINAAPFTALETLAKANGVSLIHENGIWYLRPANDSELIGRIYEINYNAQELVRKNSQGAGDLGGGGGGTSPGISLQGAPDFFEVETSRLLEDIRGILDIQTTGGIANIAPTASVDTVGQLSLRNLQPQTGIIAGPAIAAPNDPGQAKVIWNSDSNSLYVVATRQQHQWVEAYLTSADREQTMIAVEIKFLETRKDPTLDVGIDWSGVLGQNGLGVGLAGDAELGSRIGGPIDLSNIGAFDLPTAVLSGNQLSASLSALYSNSNTKAVSYPRMVTLDNREVSFRSVVNQPVLSSSASASLGAGATQTSSVEYLPIGTVINVLPKTMNNGKILLNVSVTISDIVGTEIINGNPFPVASSRVYTAPLTVESGYTVAVSGLDSTNFSQTETGVPLLGNLPFFGGAFKQKQRNRTRTHLMMLITPVVIDSCGVTKTPMTQDPWCGPCAEAHPKAKSIPGAVDVSRKGDAYATKYSAPKVNNQKKKRFFGRRKAEVAEQSYASATPVSANSSNNNFSTPSPSAPTPVISQPLRSSAPKTVPNQASSRSSSSAGKGDIQRINSNVSRLRAQLESVDKADKGKINKVVEESKTLLTQIESMRGSDSSSMTGELGDTWWSIIKLKTDAVKLSRE